MRESLYGSAKENVWEYDTVSFVVGERCCKRVGMRKIYHDIAKKYY